MDVKIIKIVCRGCGFSFRCLEKSKMAQEQLCTDCWAKTLIALESAEITGAVN